MKFLLTGTFLFSLCSLTKGQSLVNQHCPALEIETLLQADDQNAIAGKYVVLEFWATWCSPCIANIPHLNKLSEQFADKFHFISIANDSREKVEAFLKRRKINGWVAIDKNGNTSRNFGVKGIPQTFIISPEEIVVFHGNPGDLTEKLLQKISSEGKKANPKPVKKKAKERPKLGSWGGGLDPVITGSFDMSTMGYIHHEVLRKSVFDKGNGGTGYSAKGGTIGITILGEDVSGIITFTHELPSELRVMNRSSVDNDKTWDVIFSHTEGYDQQTGMQAVTHMVTKALHLEIKDTAIMAEAWTPYLEAGADTILTSEPGKDLAVRSMDDVLASLENKLEQLVVLPPDFRNRYIDMFELGNDYYNMSGKALKDWLEKKGLKFRLEKQQVPGLVVYDSSQK